MNLNGVMGAGPIEARILRRGGVAENGGGRSLPELPRGHSGESHLGPNQDGA